MQLENLQKNMQKHAKNMQKYAQTCTNMHKYAFKNKDGLAKIMQKYALNMHFISSVQKYAFLYAPCAKNAMQICTNMQEYMRKHKSLCFLHMELIYAPPTLLMAPAWLRFEPWAESLVERRAVRVTGMPVVTQPEAHAGFKLLLIGL